MFLTSRTEFKDYLSNTKKPFMANFYKLQRKKMIFLWMNIIIQLVANGVLMKKIEKNTKRDKFSTKI